MGALIGKAVVITGAGRGIGAACALSAAREGAHVVVNDIDAQAARDMADRINAEGRRAVDHTCDISQREQADALMARCLAEFGALDGLINNAGLLRNAAIGQAREEDIRAMVSVNILGTIFCGQRALEHMLDQGHGAVVNVGSGAQNGFAHLDTYCATKGAVASLTYAWAADVEGSGVRVNAISPYAATRIMQDTAVYRSARGGTFGVGEIPPPPPAEVNSPAAIFLLSDLSRPLNGQMIRILGDSINFVGRAPDFEPSVDNPRWTVADIAAAIPRLLGQPR